MKKLITGIIIMLSLIPAFAFASSQPATLAGDFHITYDGVEQDFKDGVGQSVTPIVLDGTTYLPVRAVSNIAGLNVNWNGAKKTVSLTSGGAVTTYNGTPTTSAATPISVNPDPSIVISLNGEQQVSYVNGKPVYAFIYNGTTYLPVRAVCDMVNIPVDWDATTKTVVLGTKPEDSTGSAITSTPPAVTTSSAVNTIPKDAKVLTDKDMIQLAHEYKDGAFYIESDAHVNPDVGIDFNNDGYDNVTFTVTTDDVGDKHSQNVSVGEVDTLMGSWLLDHTPQAYGQTKTYTVNISGHNHITVQVGAGGNANAIVSNIYLTK